MEQDFTAVESRRRGNSGEGDSGGAIQAALRLAGVEETTVEEVDLSTVAMARTGARLVLVHPVREKSAEVWQALHDFTRSAERPPTPIGFLAVPTAPVSIRELRELCAQAVDELAAVFVNRGDGSPVTLKFREFALTVQRELEGFHGYLTYSVKGGNIAEGDLAEMIAITRSVKTNLGVLLLQMDEMLMQLRGAA